MARRTKLTPELQERICQIIRSGNYRVTACQAVGIHPDTFNDWMKKKRQPYLRFSEAVRAAEADCERVLVQIVLGEAIEKKNWKAALEMLSRKFPANWARKQWSGDMDADGKPTEKVQSVLVVPGQMDEEEWAAAAQRYAPLQPKFEESSDEADAATHAFLTGQSGESE